MSDDSAETPDATAARVALWRAMHLEIDSPPHVHEDELGLRLLAPDESWRRRGDMDPRRTERSRASIVARARFVEDLVEEAAGRGVGQYVVLGAGLDTFVQRRPEIAARLHVFEVDKPGPQAWKRRRLAELGFDISEGPRFAPVDFERGGAWMDALADAGFEPKRPAVVAAAGVSMYLTRDAIAATLRRVASLAPGSSFVMTFMLPLELIEPTERPGREATEKFARAAGTPFISLFAPQEMLELAREAGFTKARCVSSSDLAQRYFADRIDGLRPSSSEELLTAAV